MYSEVDQFANDSNLPSFNSCVKSMNKYLSYDLKHLLNWLKANKNCLNVASKKQLDCDGNQTKWKKAL